MNIKILKDSDWKRGEYIAVALLKQSFEQIERCTNLIFREDRDDLGIYHYCLLLGRADEKEDYILLMQYMDSKDRRTEVWVLNRDRKILDRLIQYFLYLSPEVEISEWCNEEMLN